MLPPPGDPSIGVADQSPQPHRSDAIAAGLRSLTPRLEAALGEELAVDLIEWLVSLHDRQLYTESALHHLADWVGLDLSGLPDPLAPRQAPAKEGGA